MVVTKSIGNGTKPQIGLCELIYLWLVIKLIKYVDNQEIMRKTTVLLIALSLAFFGCQDDSDIEETIKYTLTIENNTSEDVDVYLNGNLDQSGFVNEGTVMAGQSKQISNLVIDVNYTLRAVLSGKPLEEYFDERNFVNNDPEKFDLTIQITQ